MSDPAGDDPRITDYVFGELNETERSEFESLCAADPNLAAAVAEVRALSARLATHFANEPLPAGSDAQPTIAAASVAQTGVAQNSTTQQPTPFANNPVTVSRQRRPSNANSEPRRRTDAWQRWALAASLLLAFGGAVTFWNLRDGARQLARQRPLPAQMSAKMPLEKSAQPAAEIAMRAQSSRQTVPNQLDADQDLTGELLSSGPMMDAAMMAPPMVAARAPAAGSASESRGPDMAVDPLLPIRQSFRDDGRLPLPETVWLAALLDTLQPVDRQPDGDSAVQIDITECPWNRQHRLVRLLIDVDSPAITGDPAIESSGELKLMFLPGVWGQIERLGSDSISELGAAPFVDHLSLPSGQPPRVLTLLYEIVPQTLADGLADESAKRVDGGASDGQITLSLDRQVVPFAMADADFRWAIALVGWGLKLQHDDRLDDWSYQQIAAVAAEAMRQSPSPARVEIADWIQRTSDWTQP